MPTAERCRQRSSKRVPFGEPFYFLRTRLPIRITQTAESHSFRPSSHILIPQKDLRSRRRQATSLTRRQKPKKPMAGFAHTHKRLQTLALSS